MKRLRQQRSLSRNAGGLMTEDVLLNVFCLKEKGKIVFTGNQNAVATFLNTQTRNVKGYINNKWKFKKMYAIRVKSEKDASSSK